MIVNPDLAQYASPTQKKYLKAVNDNGSFRAASRAMGVSPDIVRQSIRRLEREAVRQGFAPGHLESGVMPGYLLGKVTFEREADGSVRRFWDRQSPDEAMRIQALMEAIREECQHVKRVRPLPAPKRVHDQLLNLYVFTDYHLGMRAWKEEGGTDWNLETAEQMIIAAFQHMMATAPAAAVGFIAQLGDFLHFDSLMPVTPTSGHIVDSSAHFQQIVRACIRILRTMVDLALQRHEKVVILAAEGNHDISSSMWMRELLKALYENEPRVEVIDNGAPFYAYEWGVNMLSFHHGHGLKMEKLPGIFAAAFAQIWGRTRKRFGLCGHHHHEVSKQEETGMKIIRFPTMAPPDRHTVLHGYFSERQTSVMTFDKRFGLACENIVTPQMLLAA